MTRDWTVYAAIALTAIIGVATFAAGVAQLQAAPQRKGYDYKTEMTPERVVGIYDPNPAPILRVNEQDPHGWLKDRNYYLVFPTKQIEVISTCPLKSGQPLVVVGYRGVNGQWLHIVVVDLENP